MESSQPQSSSFSSWLEKPLFKVVPKITPEVIFISLILVLTILSRLIGLGWRTMSHDEVNHVVPSYSFFQGNGYSHDPVTHGPFQFHIVAASYYLFGDTDFTSRIPAALFSIATVAFVLIAWRRYLGKTGGILAGLFFTVSPYILFYGRYTRNEAFVGLYAVIMLYAVLRYLEQGKHSMMYLYTIVLVMHFCTKETSFIYTAEILIFLGLLFLRDMAQQRWKRSGDHQVFLAFMLAALFFLAVALGFGVISSKATTADTQTTTTVTGLLSIFSSPISIALYASLALAVIAMVIGLVILFRELGMKELRKGRSFDLLILTVTLILPQLIAFPIKLAGWNPLDYSQAGLIRTSIVLAISVGISTAIGLLWKPKLWAINAAIFYSIFTVLYTSMFTNGQGFFTGMVGSLGYWLSQQGVNRGTQPWYFYAFVQIPMYEYLAAMGAILGFIIGIRNKLFATYPEIAPALQADGTEQPTQIALPISKAEIDEAPVPQRLPVLTLLLYWSVLSLIAFSIAGEKMPWLTFHITLPMLLTAGFSVGFLVDKVKAKAINLRTVIAFILAPVFLIALGKTIGMLIGTNKPFAGHELAQLQTTSTFLFALIATIGSGLGIIKLLEKWATIDLIRIFMIGFFGILTITTARSAFQASFINYDSGREFLVYAHMARGPKDVLAQVEDIANRTGEGKNIKVAYIADALYPYWWYFRDYPNKTWFEQELTRDLLNYPVVISDDTQFTKTQAILKDEYVEFPYKRIVWPMQDYFNLTIPQVWNDLKDPQFRQALENIWADKDYTLYAQIKGRTDLTDETWQPAASIHLFVKKDIISKIWTYGALPASSSSSQVDPYAGKYVTIIPIVAVGMTGSDNGQFNAVRDIAIAPDGSIYAADSRNHRIQHFSADGQFISAWGTYASVDAGDAPGGTFNEPWGIAVGPDGSVYVADTWNYRIQKFTADGKFVTMWGKAGTAEAVDTFWGPRGIVVDSKGHVLITDTGNNRVVVFDKDGNYITQFGVKGMEPGEFYEPVGLAVDSNDILYVADTWNQRIQVFAPDQSGANYQFVKQWEVAGWDGQSTENKPFIDVDKNGNVYVTDPDKFRVLEFDKDGNFIKGWGDYSSGIDGFGRPVGIAITPEGSVWVSDSENNRILKFEMSNTTIGAIPQGLPDLPASSITITYNFSTGLVEDPLGQAVYRLSDDGKNWVPVIPESILSGLPLDTKPTLQDGQWVILDNTNTTRFRWEPDLLLWISVGEVQPTPTN